MTHNEKQQDNILLAATWRHRQARWYDDRVRHCCSPSMHQECQGTFIKLIANGNTGPQNKQGICVADVLGLFPKSQKCSLSLPAIHKQSKQLAHLLGWDVDVSDAVVLAHNWDVGQHIDGRDVSRKDADPVTDN